MCADKISHQYKIDIESLNLYGNKYIFSLSLRYYCIRRNIRASTILQNKPYGGLNITSKNRQNLLFTNFSCDIYVM